MYLILIFNTKNSIRLLECNYTCLAIKTYRHNNSEVQGCCVSSDDCSKCHKLLHTTVHIWDILNRGDFLDFTLLHLSDL